MHSKKTFIFLILFLCYLGFGTELSFKIHKTSGNSLIKIRKPDNSSVDIADLNITENKISVFAGKDSDATVIVYINNYPLALLLLKNGSDVDIFLSKENILTVNTNYGNIRLINSNEGIILKSNNFLLDVNPESDLSFNQSINAKSILQTEISVFNGSSIIKNLNNNEESEIKSFERLILTDKNKNRAIFNEEQINTYKDKLSVKIIDDIEPITLYLETLKLSDNNESKTSNKMTSRIYFELEEEPVIAPEEEVKNVDEIKEPKVKKRIPINKEVIHKALMNLISFETAFLYENNSPAFRVGWFPKVKLLGNKLFLSFRLDFNLLPLNFLIPEDPFYKLNNNNNEWSFGYEYIDTPAKMAFDIIEDLFLKTDYVSFGFVESPFFLEAGNLQGINDFESLRFFNYSNGVLSPFYRNTSFNLVYKQSFFRGSFYAENVATGGLFDISLRVMTPSENFRLLAETSFCLDTYDMRKSVEFSDYEMIAPLDFNNTFRFTIFNLPSFGYELYGGFGLLFPFTLNNQTYSSNFLTLFNEKADTIFNFLNSSIGQLWRFSDTTLSADAFVNSKSFKLSQYSPSYFVFRERYFSNIKSWYNNNLTASTSLLSNLIFGTRLGLTHTTLDKISFKFYYFPGFSYDLVSFEYIDRLLASLNINFTEKKIGVHYDFTIDWDKILTGIIGTVNDLNYIKLLDSLIVSTRLEIKIPGEIYFGGSASLLPASLKNGNIDINAEFYIGFNYDDKILSEKQEIENGKL